MGWTTVDFRDLAARGRTMVVMVRSNGLLQRDEVAKAVGEQEATSPGAYD